MVLLSPAPLREALGRQNSRYAGAKRKTSGNWPGHTLQPAARQCARESPLGTHPTAIHTIEQQQRLYLTEELNTITISPNLKYGLKLKTCDHLFYMIARRVILAHARGPLSILYARSPRAWDHSTLDCCCKPGNLPSSGTAEWRYARACLVSRCSIRCARRHPRLYTWKSRNMRNTHRVSWTRSSVRMFQSWTLEGFLRSMLSQ